MAFKVQYRGVSDTKPSLEIWHDCPVLEILKDPGTGIHLFDDFHQGNSHSTTTAKSNGYMMFGDTGVTIEPTSDDPIGELVMGDNDVDNDEGVLAVVAPVGTISAAGASKKLWFEARWKTASIGDNALGLFLGLAFDDGNNVPVAKTLCLTDDDLDLGAFSYLGFHIRDVGNAIVFAYKAASQTAVDKIAAVQVPVADTYYKLGFTYDPQRPIAKRIKIYVDAVEQSTYVTEANIATATFPDGESMSPHWCGKVGTNAAAILSHLDWWRFAQLY